jgi:hypothetical protein
MKAASSALQAHLAQGQTTCAYLWKVKRTDGTILGFTTHDRDISYDAGDGDGATTYLASTGFTNTADQGKSNLEVDNMEVTAFLDSSSITEADIRANLYDDAIISIRLVNWADLTQGDMLLRTGTLGVVKMANGLCTAEIRGLTYKLETVIGSTYGPVCRADFGSGLNGIAMDSQWLCMIDVTLFRQTGSLASVTDSRTLVPTAGLLQVRPAATLPTWQPDQFYPMGAQIIDENGSIEQVIAVRGTGENGPGPSEPGWTLGLSATTVDNNPDEAGPNGVTWENMGTNLGAIAPAAPVGWFNDGILTFTSGTLNGRVFEIKTWDGTTLDMFLALVPLPSAGDTFTIEPGCNKTADNCLNKFNNIIHRRAEDFIPGMDQILATPGG